MQMLKNIFNSDGKYYLELDEAQEKSTDAATKASDTTKANVKAAAKSKPVQETIKAKAEPEAASKVEEKVADAAPLKSETAPETKEVQADQKSKTVKEANQAGTNGQKTPVAKNSGASSDEPPFWVAAMYKKTDNKTENKTDNVSEPTFATDNLMPTLTKFRRRPGPSLNQFRDMAKQARIRRR